MGGSVGLLGQVYIQKYIILNGQGLDKGVCVWMNIRIMKKSKRIEQNIYKRKIVNEIINFHTGFVCLETT